MDNPNGSGQSTGKSSAAEIGRASCRERGEISGGGGSLKKKKKRVKVKHSVLYEMCYQSHLKRMIEKQPEIINKMRMKNLGGVCVQFLTGKCARCACSNNNV